MQTQAPKIIVVMGPTASGKSGIAIKLAQKFNGEIISADSRQIYRGLDIGAGKVDGAWSMEHGIFVSDNVLHHLIDVAEPMEDYNISHFKKDAEKIIREIIERGKIPIICGGTNFWIDSITKNTTIPEVAPDELLRSMLRSKTTEELFEELKKLDPERAKNIDAKNPVRLIRAIEICKELGAVPMLSVVSYESSVKKYAFLQIGIKTEREELNAKIQKRLNERFDEGMIQEVEKLQKNGVSWQWMERIGLEYRWISRFLQNKVELDEMKKLLYFDIIHFAKRQMTWLKRNKDIVWLDKYEDIEKEVKNFLEK
ncbi:MAG: tRNA dimethylallyltransferase [Candidatus Moranbacteria bacterium GW2011_GWC2_37_73]|nr:MAG: tRNA dimethylallyltransferase [Parcubacteria group bacterium GW2011_GWC1_36_108]KKQ39820.1 MAG: tRNA dimethylallyltransferase [Candidatus Moranbacteria bacterium GW2011_GWC2_37_73]HAS00032.1 tRNA (adenosine(37)-N6)-dimethylallyltransferase MiaA [Candidatus Moranbacteria bacterium]HBI50578.1 tRNA (adenosine(37)-N6)-dimethylallyltransferase MiaA [Candidatus Moranbacteria bacterium]HBU11103.1 tRNA (adenosine(37)-N6)-dimethylallyltransferase MiaA [Candidatus Moranbacteria bacterium]